MLGEILQTLGRIDSAAFSAVLLQYENSELPLGAYLVDKAIITQETLEHAIALQTDIQPSMEAVIALFDPVNRSAQPLRFTNET